MFDKELYQERYRIKSTRLPDWDYSNPGYYLPSRAVAKVALVRRRPKRSFSLPARS